MRKAAACNEPVLIPELVSFLFDDDAAVVLATEDTLAALYAGMPVASLPALDETMRSSWGGMYQAKLALRWQRLAPEQVNVLMRTDAARSALLLGLACCHASGYVRRNAVACLDQQVRTGVELPFLLLRLDDWVTPVRLQAEAAVRQRLDPIHRPVYLAHLSLVERLRAKRRGAQAPVLPRIERLLQEDVTSLLASTFAEPVRAARRYGLALAWQAANAKGTEASREVIDSALHVSRDQALRLQAARWLTAKEADAVLQREYADRLLNDRLPAVRRLALGWCVSHEPQAHRGLLHAALLDRSHAVRDIAQFYLPRQETIDLRGFYREKMFDGDAASLLPAMEGLSETGKAEDVQLFVPLAQSPRIAVRKAALSAIAKLAGASSEHLELLVAALQDGSSPGVSRQARLALERRAGEVGREQLGSIFFGSRHLHVRRQALSLINRLPKWQRVSTLIEVIGRGGAEEEPTITARHFLRDWFANYNRSHAVAPARKDVAELEAVLKRYDGALEPRLGRELQALVASWTR